MKTITNSETETLLLGESLSRELKKGDTVLLGGGLGAGKTTFTKGLARGLGITDEIVSPTFTLMIEYGGDFKLRHMDCYRLKSGEEAEFAGLMEYIGAADGISVIEWYENIRDILPADNVKKVSINVLENDKREIEIT